MPDVQSHANELWQARKSGSVCEFPSQPLSVAQAYELQFAATKASSEQVIGYKIGATSDETLGLLGLSEPFHGPIFSTNCTFTQAGDVLELPLLVAHNPRVEAEFVACLKNPVKRNDKDIKLEALLEHIAWVAPGFEFVGSRYTPPEGSPGTSVIGDFGAHQHSVIGAPYHNWHALDLRTHEVDLSINNQVVAKGHSGLSIYGHPLEFVCWLLNQPAMAEGLQAGQLISCGTCTGALPVSSGDSVEANYGMLGALKVEIG